MKIDLRPDPDGLERRAIETAVAPLLGERRPAAYKSRWRAAGIRENVEPAPQASARPRSKRGATRA